MDIYGVSNAVNEANSLHGQIALAKEMAETNYQAKLLEFNNKIRERHQEDSKDTSEDVAKDLPDLNDAYQTIRAGKAAVQGAARGAQQAELAFRQAPETVARKIGAEAASTARTAATEGQTAARNTALLDTQNTRLATSAGIRNARQAASEGIRDARSAAAETARTGRIQATVEAARLRDLNAANTTSFDGMFGRLGGVRFAVADTGRDIAGALDRTGDAIRTGATAVANTTRNVGLSLSDTAANVGLSLSDTTADAASRAGTATLNVASRVADTTEDVASAAAEGVRYSGAVGGGALRGAVSGLREFGGEPGELSGVERIASNVVTKLGGGGEAAEAFGGVVAKGVGAAGGIIAGVQEATSLINTGNLGMRLDTATGKYVKQSKFTSWSQGLTEAGTVADLVAGATGGLAVPVAAALNLAGAVTGVIGEIEDQKSDDASAGIGPDGKPKEEAPTKPTTFNTEAFTSLGFVGNLSHNPLDHIN